LEMWRYVGECYIHGMMDGEAVREMGDDVEVLTVG
jgi:hypothetical protein